MRHCTFLTIPMRGIIFSSALAGITLLSSCGKPQLDGGGPPPDAAVRSVVVKVASEPLEESITLVATLQANEQINLVSEIDARITEIGFEEGQKVTAGQKLFQLDDARLLATVHEREAQFDLANINFNRNKTLLENRTISQQEFDVAKSNLQIAQATLDRAREELEDATIMAPFDGRVTDRRASLGQFVSRGQVLSSLVDTNPLKANFDVPERFLGALHEGLKVELSTTAFPGVAVEGIVFFVSPQVDPSSRTILVKAEVINPEEHLKPGMFGALNLVIQVREAALIIPEQAVFFRRGSPNIMVRNSEGRAEIREIEAGVRMAGRVEVLKGVKEGDIVVVEGFEKMGPGSRIEVSPRSQRYGINPEDYPLPPPREEPAAGRSNS